MNISVLRNTSVGLLLLGASFIAPVSAAVHPNTAHNAVTELLVIDAAVAERETLLRGLSPSVEVLLLEQGEGLKRIVEAVKGRSGMAAIHLISHGEPGLLLLGGEHIDLSTLRVHEHELARIGAALVEGGDLLLYGCNVAAGNKGSAFVEAMASATGVDVAASDDLTGSAQAGGDWKLERQTGELSAQVLGNDRYAYVLASDVFSFEDPTTVTPSQVVYTEPDTGITMTVTKYGDYGFWQVLDAGGLYGISGFALVGPNNTSVLTYTFNFSAPIDITSLQVLKNGGTATRVILSVTDGVSGNPITVTGADWVNGTLTTVDTAAQGWAGVNAFTITDPDGTLTSGFSELVAVVDNIRFNTVNTIPVLGGAVAGQLVNDNATVSPFSGVTITDADGDNVTTTVTLDDNAKGLFTPASLAASGFTGSGPYSLALTTPANAQAAIRQLVFDPTDNRVTPGATETTTFTITVNDGTADGTNNGTSVVSSSINDNPVISGTPATTVAGHTAYSFIPAANDADGDPLTFSITNKPAWANFNTATGELSGTPTNSDVGTTTGILIGVSDGTVVTSLGAFDLTVTENLDIDGDGMPNNWETANGFDPLDPNDAVLDNDGDGLTNLEEYLAGNNPAADDNPPVVTPPADVTVEATGLFTAVDIGIATAVDILDGGLTPTSEAPTHFAPGVHTVTWSATDAAGNTGTANQVVNVIPQVSFGKDQITAEGATVSFSVILNGDAVSYPVDVPYTVSGSAMLDGSDHSLASGIASITSGTEAVVSFTTVNDGPGEGDETIIVTMGSPTNAVTGSRSSHTILLVEGNVAPQVGLVADQGLGNTRIVTQMNGTVQVLSTVSDANVIDTHSYDWSGSDNALVDIDGAADTFTFDPSGLTPGLYTVRLSISDGTESGEAELALNVVASAPILSAADDSDRDGINDVSEGFGDTDNDGVADYLDGPGQSNVLAEIRGISNQFMAETEPGLNLVLNAVAMQTHVGQVEVTMADIVNAGGPADELHSYSGGLFDFIVTRLPVAGQSVNVVFPQRAPVPANAVYRKLMGRIWQDYVVDAGNAIASAAGAEGFCPPPGDAAYRAGLTEGHWCVQVTIEDGGPNDSDGKVNKRIVDPSGVGERLTAPVDVAVSGGGGALHPLWLLLVLFGMTRFVSRREGSGAQCES